MSIPVKLSSVEYQEAYDEGTRKADVMSGTPHLDGSIGPNYRNDREGAAAELAVALWLDQPWTAKGQKPGQKGDVAGYYEVRWCYSRNVTLKVREHDRMDVPYILVTGQNGHYTIHGWQWGQTIVDIGEYMPPEGGWTKKAWQVRVTQLEPMSTLPLVGARPWR